MTKRPRRNHMPALKAKAALAAVKGEKTLDSKIGELTLVDDFLEGALGNAELLPSGNR